MTKRRKSVEDLLGEREETHGDFIVQAEAAQRMVECVSRSEGWSRLAPWMRYGIQMILMKVARIVHGDCREPDHWRDIQGYSRLIERELTDDTHVG